MNGNESAVSQVDLPLREWWSPSSAFPHSLREPIEVLVALGVSVARIDWEFGDHMGWGWSDTHDFARESALPSLRALDDWCPGDGVIALTDDRFGVLEVHPRLGGLQPYAQIEHMVRMTKPIGILEAPYGRFEVLIDDPHIGCEGPGIRVLAGGCDIVLPANANPERKGEPRWQTKPTFGSRRISGRVVPVQLRIALGSVAAPLDVADSWLEEYPPSGVPNEGPPSTLSESAESTIVTAAPADLLVELFLAAGAMNAHWRGDDEFLTQCENDLLGCAARHPAVHRVGFAACLAAIRSGLSNDELGCI